MKKLLLVAVMGAFVATTVVAQDSQQPPAQKKDMKMDHAAWDKKVKDELKLTPDQVTKYDAVSKEFGTKIEALQADATLTDDARKERKIALKKEKETKLNEFLTPEQQTRYKELIEKKKAEAKPGS
jgi:hypothetical protein